MRVRKAVQKIAALGVGVSMVGATILGAMAADLSEYPDPLFVKNGQFDGVIVVGDRAAAEDVVGAINIATSLQYAVGQPVAVPTQPGGRGGSLAISGDAVSVSEPNNLLEIRERMGAVKETLTEFDLAGLQGGTIVTDEGSTDYNQYLRFDDSTNTTSSEYIPSGTVVFAEDEDDIVGDYLKFVDGEDMFEYELEFEEGVESDLTYRTGTSGPQELDDLEDEELNMLGKVFSVVDTRAFFQGGASDASVRLDLLGGDVLDTLEEGETRTYTIDGKEYEVSLVIVSDNRQSAKFNVNGEISDELKDGDTDVLRDGTEVGIREILPNEADEETGGDLVEFFLGANKVTLEDTNFSDDAFATGGVEIHEESVEDARVKIKASNTSDTMEIQTIQYRLKADSPKGDIFVPPGHGVREYLDEPEGMLSDAWDIRYEGLMDTGVSIIRFDAAGDDSYDLHFTNRQGLEYVVPFVDNSRDEVAFFKYGDDDNDLIFSEGLINNSLLGLAVGLVNTTLDNGEVLNFSNTTINDTKGNIFNIDEDDYFVLTDSGGSGYAAGGDETSFTHILSYETIDTGNTKITFNDEGTGQREVKYSATTTLPGVLGRSQTLIVGGNTYDVYVSNGSSGVGSAADGRYPIAIDQNSDGTVSGDEIHVVVNGGGILDLGGQSFLRTPSVSNLGATAATFVLNSPKAGHSVTNLTTTADNSFLVNLTTLATEFDGNGVHDLGFSESVYINISAPSSGQVDLFVPSPQNVSTNGSGIAQTSAVNNTQLVLRMESLDEEDLRQGLSSYGAFFEQTDETDSNDADDLTIEYPLAQRGADVFVTIGSTQTTRVSAAAGGSAVVLNPISVGSAKLASEVAGQETRMNMIVVGGPCINSAAATLMGSSEPLCGEASGMREGQGLVKLFENGENVAMLVAGWSKEDTRRATRVVSEYEDWADKLVGKEVVVTGTSLSDIDVSAPAAARSMS